MSGSKQAINSSMDYGRYGSQSRPSPRRLSPPHRTSGTGDTRPECRAIVDNGLMCGETQTLRITDELKKLYENRLRKLDEDIGENAAGDSGQLQMKVNVLQSWVHDLLEQNAELVYTVEELEREIGHRVKLLEEKLMESARACREYMTKIHDFESEMRDVAADKEELARKDALIQKLEAELRALQQRSANAGGTDGEIATLKEHLGLKDSQIRSLIQRIQELREDIIKKSSAVSKLLSRNTQDASTMTDEWTSSSKGTCATESQCYDVETNMWKEKASTSRSERRALSTTYDEDTMRLQENLKRKKAELEKVNDKVDALGAELQSKDDIINSLQARLQDQQFQQRDDRRLQQSEHERKVHQVEESLAKAKIGMKASFEELKAAHQRFGDDDSSSHVEKMQEYDQLCRKENAALEAMRKEINSLLEQVKERENKISNQDMEISALQEKLISIQNAHKEVKEQSLKYINELHLAEQHQQESERRISELHNSLKRAQENMQGCLLKLEESTKSPADVSKTVIITEAKAFQSKAEEGQAAFDNMKAEMDFLLNNLHSREGHIKELEEIIDNLQSSLEKTQQQLMQVQTNANAYLKERDRSYRKEEEAREKIAALQSELEGTIMEKQKSWHELKRSGSRRISFAPPHMVISDYEATFEKEEVATDEMKEEMQSLLRDLRERDSEIAAQAHTIQKLQAELMLTQKTLKEMQRKEVAILGDRSRAQKESDTKILELEGALKAARADLNQSQDRLTTLEIDRRTHGVSFHGTVPEARAGPSNEWGALEKARAEIGEIAQKLEARERHIKKQDEVIHALQAALDQAQAEVNKLQATSAIKPDPSAQRAGHENKQRIERMKTAIKASEDEFSQSQERIKTLEHTLGSPRSYGKNRPMSSKMDDFRLNTVEAQATVEDMLEEMESLMKNMNSREKQISELESMIGSLQHTLAQYEREMTELREKTEAIEREKITSALNLKDREKKIQQLQEALDSTQINMKKSFEKLQASKQQSDAQDYQAKAREGQLAMDKMTDEMKNVIHAVKSREKQLSQKEEIIKTLQRSLEQTKIELAAIQKKAVTYLNDKENAEQKRKESERKLEKLQAELENAQDELRQKVEQFTSYEVQSEMQIKSKIAPITPRQSFLPSNVPLNDAEASKTMEKMKNEVESLIQELGLRDKQLASQEEMISSLRNSLLQSQKQVKDLNQFVPRTGLHDNIETSRPVKHRDPFQYDKDSQISDLELTLERSRDENQVLQNKIKAYEKQTSQKPVAPTKSIIHSSAPYREKDDQNKALVMDLQHCRGENKILHEKIAALESNARSLEGRRNDKTDRDKDRQISDLESALARSHGEIQSLHDRIKVYELQISEKPSKKSVVTPRRSVVRDTTDYRGKDEEANRTIKKLKAEIDELVAELERRDNQTGAQEEMIGLLRQQLAKAQRDAKSLQQTIDTYAKNLDQIMKDQDGLQVLQNRLTSLEIDLKLARQQVAAQEETIQFQRKTIADLERNVGHQSSYNPDIMASLQHKDRQIQRLEEEINELRSMSHQPMHNISKPRQQSTAYEESKRYLEKSKSCQDLKSILLRKDQQIEGLEEELDELQHKLKQAKMEASNLRQQHAPQESKRFVDKTLSRQDLEAKLHQNNKHIQELEDEMFALENKLKQSTNEATGLREQLQKNKLPVDKTISRQDLEAKLHQNNRHIKALEDEMFALENKLKQSSKEASGLREQLQENKRPIDKTLSRQDLETKLHQKDKQIRELEEDMNALENKFKQAKKEASGLREQLEACHDSKRHVDKTLSREDLEAKLRQKDKQIRDLEEEVNKLNSSMKQSKMEASNLREQLHAPQDSKRYVDKTLSRQDLEMKLHEKDKQIRALEDEMNTLENKFKQASREASNLRQQLKDVEQMGTSNVKSRTDPEIMAKLHEKDRQIAASEDELDKLRNHLRQSQMESLNLRQDLEMAKEMEAVGRKKLLDPKDRQIDALQEEVQDLRRSLQQCKTEAAAVRQNLQVTEEKERYSVKGTINPEIKAQLEEKNHRINLLEEELNTLRNNLKQSKMDADNLRQDIKFAEDRGKLGVKSIIDADCIAKLREKDKQIDDLDEEINKLRSSLKHAKMELADLKEHLEMAEERSQSGKKCLADPDVKAKLHEKDEKIEALEAELNEFRHTLKNSKLELSNLREDLKMAEERAKTDGKLITATKSVTKCREKDARIGDLEAEINTLRNTVANCKSELRLKDNRIEELEAELNSLRHSLKSSKQELSTIKEDLSQERDRMGERSGKDADFKRMLNEKSRELGALEQELDLARNAENNYKKEINRLKQDIKVLEERINSQPGADNEMYGGLRKHLEEKNRQIENQEEEMNLLRNTMNNYKREIGELKRALGDVEKDIPELQRELKASQERLMSKGEAVNFLQGTLGTTQEELRKLQLEIERMLREKGESQTAIQGLQSELDKAKRDGQQAKEMMATIEEQQKELDNYRRQLEKLQGELNRANAEIQSLQSTLKAKEKLLADQEEMGAIQKDTIKRSQDEFNRLKEKLDKLESAKKDCDKEKDELKDKIHSLEAELRDKEADLRQMQEIDREKNRLQNELEDALARSKNMEEILKEINQLRQDNERLENQMAQDAMDAQEEMLVAQEALRNQIDDLEGENDNLRDQMQRLQDLADATDENLKSLEAENEQLSLDIEELTAELNDTNAQNAAYLADIEDLQRTLGDVKTKMSKLKKNHEAALKQNKENEQMIADLKDDVKNYAHELDLNNVQLEAKQKEADDIRNMLESLQGSQVVLEDLIQKKEDEMHDLQIANQGLQDELERLINEKQAQDTLNNNLTEMLKDIQSKAEKAEKGYHKAMENAQRTQAELVDAVNREAQLKEEFANKENDILDKLRDANSEAQQLSDAVNMLNGEVQNLQAELADREGHLLATEADLESLGQSLQKLHTDVNNRNEAIKKLKENEKQYIHELEEKDAALTSMMAEHDQLCSDLNNMQQLMEHELENMRRENDTLDAEKANLAKLLQGAQNKIDKLEKSFHKAMENSQKNQAALIDAVNREEQLKEEFENKEQALLDQLRDVSSELDRLSESVAKRNEAIKKLKTNENELTSRLGEMEAALQEQVAEAANLTSQRAKMQHRMQKELDRLQDEIKALDSENIKLVEMLKSAQNEAKQSEMGYHDAMESSQRNQAALIKATKREAQLKLEFADKEKELQDQLRDVNLEAQQLSDTVQSKNETIKKLKANEKQLISKLGETEAALQAQATEAAQLSKLHHRMKNELESLKSANQTLDSDNANLAEMLKDAERKSELSEASYHQAMENNQINQAALIEAANKEVLLQQEFADKEKELLDRLRDENLEVQRLSNDVVNKIEAIKKLKAMEKQLTNQLGETEAALNNQVAEVANLKAQLNKMHHRIQNELESLKNENQRLSSENANLAGLLNCAETKAKKSELGYHEAMENSQRNQAALIEAVNREAELERQFADKERDLLAQLGNANCKAKRLNDDVQSKTDVIKKLKASEKQLAGELGEKEACMANQVAEIASLKSQLCQIQHHMQNKLKSLKDESHTLDSENANLAEMLKEAENEAKQSEIGYHEAMDISQRNQQALIEATSREAQLERVFGEKEKKLLTQLQQATCKAERLAEDLQKKTEALKKMRAMEDQLANQLEEKDAALNNQCAEIDDLNSQLKQMQQCLLDEQRASADQLACMMQESAKLKSDVTNLMHLQDKTNAEKTALAKQTCRLKQAAVDYQNQLEFSHQKLEQSLAVQSSLKDMELCLEEKIQGLESELAFMRDAFQDLQCNYMVTTNSVENLKCQLSEANMNCKGEVKDLCLESRCLVNNVRQWINQQISDNTKLCSLIKAKSAVNHKLAINLQNLLIKNKGLQQQNAKLRQALQVLQDCPRDMPPMPSCLDWPDASMGPPTSSTLSITHYYQTELDQESPSPDNATLSLDAPCSQPRRNRSVTWATTMTEFVDEPKCQRNRKRQIRSLTRS